MAGEKNKTKEARRGRWVKWAAILMGFAVGLIAYWPIYGKSGELTELFYQTLCLMTGTDPSAEDIAQNGFLMAAQFICQTGTCVFLLSLFTSWIDRGVVWCRSCGRKATLGGRTFGKDAVAIYGANALAAAVAEDADYIPAGERLLRHAKSHIILMEQDEESLRFYERYKDALHRGNTYIGLWQISSFLMQSTPNVHYFNVYEEVARDYWKRCPLRGEPAQEIVLLGYGRRELGYQVLKYGLMYNLFRADQAITYHVFCGTEDVGRGFEQLELMNGDKLVWHTAPWQDERELIRRAQRTVLCRAVEPHTLNELMLTCTGGQIDYYDPTGAAYPRNYDYPRGCLRPFGCTRDLLNEATILKGKLYRSAMDRHYMYLAENGSDEERSAIAAVRGTEREAALKTACWNELSSFLKGSNAACADYYELHGVPADITAEALEERAALEHLRWCRFHFVCGWRYGEPESGARKDALRRLHRDLVPWEVLPETERQKDRQQVAAERMTPEK